ncbi:MAG: type IV secretion protein IcmD [Pseudomonadota bacterium]
MGNQLKVNVASWIKAIFVLFVMAGALFSGAVYADDAIDIGTVAGNVTDTFQEIAQLITAASYVAGLGFAVGAILKFKAHKDNPQQITVGVPIALMFVAAALIFLPSMFDVAGGTLFGSSSAISAGITGITTFS